MYGDQGEAEIMDLCEQTVQRCLVDDGARDDSDADGLVRNMQPVEPG